jgi:hypothetical protein
VQSSPSQLRNGEAVTEPSGQGPFAEAMRELIAELRPARGPLLRLLRGGQVVRVPARDAQPASGAGSHAHLKLLR